MVLVASPPALPRIESVPFRLTAVTKPETVRIQYKRIMLGRNKNKNLTFVSNHCFFVVPTSWLTRLSRRPGRSSVRGFPSRRHASLIGRLFSRVFQLFEFSSLFFLFLNAGHAPDTSLFWSGVQRPAQHLHHETRNFSNSSSKNSRLHTLNFTFVFILGQLNYYYLNVSKFGRKQTWPRSSWTSPWGCCRRCGLSQDACQPHLLPGTCGQRVSRWASRPVSSLACKCLEFSTNIPWS